MTIAEIERVSLIDVLHADENVLRAADMRAQAQTESARAAVAAFKALGGGWQARDAEAIAVNRRGTRQISRDGFFAVLKGANGKQDRDPCDGWECR